MQEVEDKGTGMRGYNPACADNTSHRITAAKIPQLFPKPKKQAFQGGIREMNKQQTLTLLRYAEIKCEKQTKTKALQPGTVIYASKSNTW